MRHARSQTTRWSLAALLAAPALAIAASAAAQPTPVAPGWYVVADRPGEYVTALEPLRRPYGAGWAGATIRSIVPDPDGVGSLAQSIRADEFRGQRVRLTGWLRNTTPEYLGQSGLWMRVDAAKGVVAADLMTERAITGTKEWAQYTVVLDVPRDAVGITFGLALAGQGQVWLDDVTFEVVGRDVATTGGTARDRMASAIARPQLLAYRMAPTRPVNLDFERTGVIAAR